MNNRIEKKNDAVGQPGVLTSVYDNRELILRCASGDKAASEIFVRRFSDPVYGCIQYTLISRQIRYIPEDLEDFHNTVFLKLFEKRCKRLRQFTGKNGGSFQTWLRVVTVRTVLNLLRKKGVDSIAWREKSIPLDSMAEIEDERLSARGLMEKTEKRRILKEEINKLSFRERLFLKLHLDHGHSISKAAEIMKISVQNAYTIKHRAIHKLKLFISSKF